MQDVDRRAGAAIPFLWDKAALVQSKDVVGVASAFSAYITTHDLTFTSLKR